MRKRIVAGLLALAAALFVGLGSPGQAIAQDKKAPKFLYGHDVLVRPGGVKDFNEKTTKKIGIEVFQDETTNALVAISETGELAVLPAITIGMDRTCKWLTAHDLAVRKAGEAEFTEKTKKWGVELFRDLASNRLLYVCESAAIAFAPIPGSLVTDRGPKWHHALEPKVRRPGESSFDAAKKFGLEVFKDEKHGRADLYHRNRLDRDRSRSATCGPEENRPPKTATGWKRARETNRTSPTRRSGSGSRCSRTRTPTCCFTSPTPGTSRQRRSPRSCPTPRA